MTTYTDEHIKQMDHDCVMGTYARLPVVLERGQGPYVWDVNGKKYLDFLAGIAVNVLGHAHPALVAAVQAQAATLMHTSNIFYTIPQPRLAQKLLAISGFDKAFFANSGAEANEAAIKLARKYGKKDGRTDKFRIITAQRSFHGRTMATVTATAQEKYQKPFAPMLTGFDYVPYNDVAALQKAMGPDVCAVMLEPVQGEGGVYPADPAYLQEARALCDANDALLIFDEVQTGIGRTGHWFAFQHYGVTPDVMTLAKALGGGFPIGACLATGAAASVFAAGDHGTTFGGNPLACATALTVLETIEKDGLCTHAQEMGRYFLSKAQSELGAHLKDTRGLGLMMGLELTQPVAKKVLTAALERGLIVNAVGETTLRLLPPLIIEREHCDEAIAILKDVLAEISGSFVTGNS